MSRVDWQPAEIDVVLKIKLKHFRRFTRSRAIVNKYSRFMTSERFDFVVKDRLEPL